MKETTYHYFSSMDYYFFKICNFKKHKHTPLTKHTSNREYVMSCIVKPTDLDLNLTTPRKETLYRISFMGFANGTFQ